MPTPVSSLLHAATMVCSGVFVLVRSSFILEYTPSILLTILWLGGVTTLVSGLIAIVSNDIKRVIALSTMSQLARKYYILYIYIFRNLAIYVKIYYNIYIKFYILFLYFINQYNYILSYILLSEYNYNNSNNIIMKINSNNISNKILLLDNKFKNNISKEVLSLELSNNKKILKEEEKWYEWLSGLIDGRGQFIISKKGYASLKIIINNNNKSLLYEIKHKLGGSIKSISGSNSLKYKLHDKKGMIKLIKNINGLIRNPSKMIQLNKLCNLYNINFIEPKPLTYNNGWFSGLLDSDGKFDIDEKSNQLKLTIYHKNNYLLNPLIKLYNGKINITKFKDSFKYEIYKKNDLLNLNNYYLSNYKLKSNLYLKFNLINNYYNYLLLLEQNSINNIPEEILYSSKDNKLKLKNNLIKLKNIWYKI